MEQVEFSPEAGLADKRVIDASGNVTVYDYEDFVDSLT